MKSCPKCKRVYQDETLNFCLEDGEWLVTEGSATSSEPQTAVLPDETNPRTRSFEEKDTRVYTSGAFVSKEFRKHKFGAAIIAGIVLVVLAGFIYGLYRFLTDRPTPPERSGLDIKTQRLTGDGRSRSPVISPDGKFLVFVKFEAGQQSLWIKQIQTGSSVNVVKPGESDEFWGITFSPDGNFVYYNAGGLSAKDSPTVFRVPTLGGNPVKYLTNAYLAQFSNDGKQVSFRRSDIAALKEKIFIANSDGSREREIASRLATQFFTTGAPWSPDGKFLAVGIGDDTKAPEPGIVPALISTVDGSITEVGTKKWEGIDDIIWHPSGDSLIMVASENSFIPGQVWELTYPAAEYRRLTNNINGHYGASITNDGKSIVTGELFARSSIWVSPDLKPENAKQVMPATGDTWGFGWAPDGRIVYSSEQTGDIQIWIMNADGTGARPLTTDQSPKLVPTVSPDGRYVVYTSTPNGGEIVRIDIDGGNLRVLTNNTGSDNPHFSPDGKWVIYSAYVDGIPRILRVPIDGGDGQILTPDVFATEPRYSNDGTRFACFLLDQKALVWNKIAIYPAEGGQPIQMLDVPGDTNQTRGPVWTPDDKNLIVIVAPGEKQNLWQIPVDGRPGKQMTNFDVPGTARREFSRDGKRIAIVRAEGFGNAIMITDFR